MPSLIPEPIREYIDSKIIQPIIDKALSPVANMVKKLSIRSAVIILILISISSFAYVYSEEIFYGYNALTNDKIYIHNSGKIDSLIFDLSKDVVTEYNSLDSSDVVNNAWSVSQMISSVAGNEVINESIFLNFNKKNQIQDGTWDEQTNLQVTHFASTAWVLISYGLLHHAIADSIISTILARQLTEGGWPMYPTDDESFGSTYATIYTIQGLSKIEPFIANTNLKMKVDRHIHLAIEWLEKTQDANSKLWKDYPNITTPDSKLNKPLTSIVLHTLNNLKIYRPEDTRDYFFAGNEIDNDIWKNESSQIYYPKTGTRDATIIQNFWQFISVPDIYSSCSLLQKIELLRWVNNNINMVKSSDFRNNLIWTKCEFLIVLKHLRNQSSNL